MTAVEPAGTQSLPMPRTASELMARSRAHVPHASPYHLRRERLAGLLASSTAPLALLSAPAGSGKTALAVEWAQLLGDTREVVWVSCRSADVDPWADVLRRTGSADGVQPALRSSRWCGAALHERVEQVVEAIGRSPVPWTVFLDGYDLRSAEAAEELDLLLTYAGDALQVVLTTRADPVLPLHRYRLAGALLEVRAAGPGVHRRGGRCAAAGRWRRARPRRPARAQRAAGGAGPPASGSRSRRWPGTRPRASWCRVR